MDYTLVWYIFVDNSDIYRYLKDFEVHTDILSDLIISIGGISILVE